jgi:hypothetical protein
MKMNVDVYVQSFQTATDLSAKAHYLVKLSADMTVELAGNGESAVGVLQNKPASGKTADVKTAGRTPVYVGSAVTFGQKLASDANGKAVPAATGDHVVGIALSSGDSTAAQPMVDMLVTLGGAPLP